MPAVKWMVIEDSLSHVCSLSRTMSLKIFLFINHSFVGRASARGQMSTLFQYIER